MKCRMTLHWLRLCLAASSGWKFPAGTRRLYNAGLMLGQHCRCWTNIKPTFDQCFVSGGLLAYTEFVSKHILQTRTSERVMNINCTVFVFKVMRFLQTSSTLKWSRDVAHIREILWRRALWLWVLLQLRSTTLKNNFSTYWSFGSLGC